MKKSIEFLAKELTNNYDAIHKVDAILFLKNRFNVKPNINECLKAYEVAYN